MTTNAEMYFKCMQIEALVTSMVVCGITDNKKLVEAVDKQFHPETEWEQEMYSEAIIYAKQAVLN
jgi:anthranilate/para-aminobenzoate synthase component II